MYLFKKHNAVYVTICFSVPFFCIFFGYDQNSVSLSLYSFFFLVYVRIFKFTDTYPDILTNYFAPLLEQNKKNIQYFFHYASWNFNTAVSSKSNMLEGLPNASDHSSQIASEQLENENSFLSGSGTRFNLSTRPPSNRIPSSHSFFRSPKIEKKYLQGEDDSNALGSPEQKVVRGSGDEETMLGKSAFSSSVRVAPPLQQMSKTPFDPDAVKALQNGLTEKSYTPNSHQGGRTTVDGYTLAPLPSSSSRGMRFSPHTPSKNSFPVGAHRFHTDFNSSLLAKHKRFLLQSSAEHHPFASDRGSLYSSSRILRDKQACTGAEKGSTSTNPFYHDTGRDCNKVTSSPRRSFPPPPPRFSLHHPHGFRLLKSSSVVERSLRHYFRLPEAPSAALNCERRCVQEQLLWLEKEEKESRQRMIRHRKGGSSYNHTSGENDDGIVLDGFLLLSASSCESPDEVKVVSLQCSQLEKTIPEDLVYFQNLSFLDLSENKLLLEDLLLLGGVRTLHLACNGISSLEDLHSVAQWQLNHRKSILVESLLPLQDPTLADTEETLVSHTTRSGMNPIREKENCIDKKNDDHSFEILLPSLTALNLSYNRIPSSHICFLTYFPVLHQLDLSGNNLQFLPKDMSCLASVSHLALECNNFTIASSSAFSAASKSFSGGAIGLFQSLSTMPSLLEVNLNRNHIECVPPLSPLPGLPFFFTRLKVVGLAHNPIKKVDDILPLISLHHTLRRLALFETPLSIEPKESTRAQYVVDNVVEALFKAKIVVDARVTSTKEGRENEKKNVPEKKCQPCNSSSPKSTEIEDDLWTNDTWSRLIPLCNDPLLSSSFPMNSNTTLPPEGNDGTTNDSSSGGDNLCDGVESEPCQFHKSVEESDIAKTNFEVGSEGYVPHVRNAAVAAAAAAAAARKAEAGKIPAYEEELLFSDVDACRKQYQRSASPLFLEHQQRELHKNPRFSYSPMSVNAEFAALMNRYFTGGTERKEGNTPLFYTSQYQQLHFNENLGSSKNRGSRGENTEHLPCADGLFSPSRLTEYIRRHRVELLLEGNHLQKKSTGKFLSEHHERGQEDFLPMTIPSYEEFMNIYVLEGGKRACWKRQQARRKREGLRPPSPLILVKTEPSSTPPSCEKDKQGMPAHESEEASQRTALHPEEEVKPLPLCRYPSSPKLSSPPPSSSDDHVFLTAMDGGCWEEAKMQKKEMGGEAEVTAVSSIRGASVCASESYWPPKECGNHNTAKPFGSSVRVTSQPLSSFQPVIPTNVHTAMKELRSLLRKPLPSLPYRGLHYSSKTKK